MSEIVAVTQVLSAWDMEGNTMNIAPALMEFTTQKRERWDYNAGSNMVSYQPMSPGMPISQMGNSRLGVLQGNG